MKELLREILGITMMLCFSFCAIPQIFKIIKNKSSENISIWLAVLPIIGYITGLFYMTLSSFVFWILINQIVGLTISVVLVGVFLRYKK